MVYLVIRTTLIIVEKNNIINIEDSYGYFDAPCAYVDSTIGYKWAPGNHRIIKKIKNKIIYNNQFHVNMQGYTSRIDFHKIKNKK